MTTKPNKKDAKMSKTQPAQTVAPAVEAVPADGAVNGNDKPHSNSSRDNSFLKWKPSTLARLDVVAEKWPEVASHVNAIREKIRGLPDDFSPGDKLIPLKAGDVVRLPEHEKFLKGLKLENRGVVESNHRGVVKVKVGEHSFTVPARTVEILERAQS